MFEVLLHTLIDWMRTEEDEDEGRLINHHGKSITVGGKQGTDTVHLVDAVLNLRILFSSIKAFKILLPFLLSLHFFTGAEHESWTKQPDEETHHWENEQE